MGIHTIVMVFPGQRKSREQLTPRKQATSWGYKSPSATTPGKSNSMFNSNRGFLRILLDQRSFISGQLARLTVSVIYLLSFDHNQDF